MQDVSLCSFLPENGTRMLVHEWVLERQDRYLTLCAQYLSVAKSPCVALLAPLSSLLDASREELARAYLFHAYISRLDEEFILETKGFIPSSIGSSVLPIYSEETEFGIEAKCYALVAFSLSQNREPVMSLSEFVGVRVDVSKAGVSVNPQIAFLALHEYHRPRFSSFIDLVQREESFDPGFIRLHYLREYDSATRCLYGKKTPTPFLLLSHL